VNIDKVYYNLIPLFAEKRTGIVQYVRRKQKLGSPKLLTVSLTPWEQGDGSGSRKVGDLSSEGADHKTAYLGGSKSRVVRTPIR